MTATDRLADFTGGPDPWGHQDRAFSWIAERGHGALAMEQRCGKTKVAIGKAVRHFTLREIRGLVVVAMPGDVHVSWVEDELPAHLPPGFPCNAHAWRAAKAGLASHRAALDQLINTTGLAVLTVNGEAAITPAFRAYLGRFLKARSPVMAVVDEQTLVMKTPGSKRAKLMKALGRRSAFRVIMDGTPVGEGPLDLYAPYDFLGEGLLGHRLFSTFRAEFAEYETRRRWDPKRGAAVDYPALVGYRNLDALHERMARHTFRVLRRDCFDMPDKVYAPKRRFSLTPAQRRVYDGLRDEYRAEADDGMPLTAANVLTRYLRLQQVTSNFWPETRGLAVCPACSGDGCDACDGLGALEATFEARAIDPDRNPRLDALEGQLRMSDEPAVVWARFRRDVDDVVALAGRLGRSPVRYDGACSSDQKTWARREFQAGRAGLLVGSARAGGRGLRLDAARAVHYYSNEFPLLVRLQSEDRAEAPGREVGTGVYDYVAEDTVDEDVVDALRAKRAVADHILNERSGGWI